MKLAETLYKNEQPRGRVALAMKCAGVQHTAELDRVLALPRRTLDLTQVRDLTSVYALPGCALKLRPIQSVMLQEAAEQNGLIAGVGVGHGKTLASLLLPTALQSEKAVLLVMPELKRQLMTQDLPFYGANFKLPLDKLTIVAYSELSQKGKWDILRELRPDLIIADEMQKLRNRDSARTKRFFDYFDLYPGTRFCGLTGSLTTRTIRDYLYLMELALKKNSPLPNPKFFRVWRDWADALDPPQTDKGPMNPGALLMFCEPSDWVGKDGERLSDTDAARRGFARRLTSTPGVVTTVESSCGASLFLVPRTPKLPQEVVDTLANLRRTWCIGQNEIEDAMAFAKYARQVAAGFYYRWVWPKGPDGKPLVDYEWLEARSAFHREGRAFLKYHKIDGIDSPGGYMDALRSGAVRSATWEVWKTVEHRPEPPTEAVWISDFLVQDALAWAKEAKSGIIWYVHDAVGTAVSRIGGLPLYAGGVSASDADPRIQPVIVCSVRAQKEGKNLQRYNKNYISSPMANGDDWEQLLGRTHRAG